MVSILAGKTIGDLRSRLPGARAIVRAMPNLPASIGRGATGAAASPEVSAAQRAMADTLLRSIGIVEWLAAEDLIDAVTAVSGSGPGLCLPTSPSVSPRPARRPACRRTSRGGSPAPR